MERKFVCIVLLLVLLTGASACRKMPDTSAEPDLPEPGTETEVPGPEELVLSGASWLSECRAPAGSVYRIFGEGFQQGDLLVFSSSLTEEIICASDLFDGGAAVVIPEGMVSGNYCLEVRRGESARTFGEVYMEILPQGHAPAVTECIAHRCWHVNGGESLWPENSLAAFERTFELGV